MAKIDVIQTSIASGEFGPSLFGRTDLAQYENACETVENFLVRPYGSGISTPGTRYVATVSDSTLNTRLVKFIFNKTDAYAIEMGDKYLRFFTNRGQVVTAGGTEDLSALDNLVSQWKLNDDAANTTVADGEGSHSGTSSTNTVNLSTTGKINDCFDMDEQYYVTIPDHADFTRTASSTAFSITAFIYYTDNGGAQEIFTKYEQNANAEYRLWAQASGNLGMSLYDASNAGIRTWFKGSVLSDGWNMVGVTVNGVGDNDSDVTLYVNGKVLDNPNISTLGTYVAMEDTGIDILIGARRPSTPTAFFADKIDNVAFFHDVLTPTEMATISGVESAYQITTVFTADEIWNVKYTQLNDVVWLAHPNHPPQKLVRTSANEWAISDYSTKGGPFLDENTDDTITINPSAATGTINITVSPTNSNLFTVSSSTLGHQDTYWMIGGLAKTNATTGLEEVGYVQVTDVINSYTATATVIKTLKSTVATAVWAEGAWSAVRGYPAKVGFHERRLWWARTSHEPQKVWGSRVFKYDDYALDTQADDDGLNLPLASNESNEIQWLTSGKSLIAGTFGGAFVVNSESSEVITPENATSSEEVGVGANSIQPKLIGSFVYYIQRFSKKLREMFYFWDLDSYKAVDRTILAPHVFGEGIVDMDYQQNPDTVLYCVRTDGTLATMTREVDQEVTAWSRQTTAGTYSSIAVIPSQSYQYDEAWVIVERWIGGAKKKYVEFFEDIEIPDRQDKCCYLHSALTYDAYESTSTSSCTISLSATTGNVTVTSSTAYFNGEMVGRRVRAIDEDGVTLGEGQITATASTTSMTLSITTNFSALAYSAGRWGVSVSSVSGLDHLEAEVIGILADGVTESLTRTVASGAVTLGSNYFVIWAGKSYDQIIYTLPKEAGSQRGTSQGKLQRVNELAFKLNRSYLGFKYGFDADNLDTLTDVDSTLTQSLTTDVIRNVPFRPGYQVGTQVYIKNSSPLPVELLSLIMTLDTQDK